MYRECCSAGTGHVAPIRSMCRMVDSMGASRFPRVAQLFGPQKWCDSLRKKRSESQEYHMGCCTPRAAPDNALG